MSTKKLFILMTIFAFVGAISFFQVNSYFGDQHHFNGGFITIGCVCALVAAYFLYRVNKNGGTPPSR